ncbi:AT-hook motif nuclear-localized 9-like [Olea europaea subsp. europaea]|uniref:AT-hook motif nuclear-localized protein n=1 Tax=Olea europaea subsp. europaea TaxID=158383 RepID=A0A8S0T5S6_OLEEU|nr:AT-hook motif nuclear-localized 9-like [Olea europaea subsp. europaea]
MEEQNNQSILTRVMAGTAEQVAVTAIGTEEYLNNGGNGEPGESAMSVTGGSEVDLPAKRKRGRPKKQLPELKQEFLISPEFSAPPKRGRGRPKGSGKWQTLAASLGGEAVDTAGSDFIPHVVTIQTGENISQHIWSFSQRTSASTFIISASGTVSIAEICHSSSFDGMIRYEGRFEIVTLTGSYTYNEMGGVRRKVALLSVQLATPEGRLFGGRVAGLLIAAGPTQLVIAAFKQNMGEKLKRRYLVEPPRPNNGVAATTLPMENKLFVSEENLITTTPAMAPTIDAADNIINGPDPNHTSIQPFDWNSTRPSELASEHVTSNVDAGSTLAQIVSPREQLPRPPSPYIPLPPSF